MPRSLPGTAGGGKPGEEGRHRVEIPDGDADVIEVPDRRHGVHPPVFVRQVRFSLVRLSAGTPRLRRAHGSRICVVHGVDDHSPLRPRRRPPCERHYTTRWNALIYRMARYARADMAVARLGFARLAAQPSAVL